MMDVNLSEIRGIGKTRLQALKADGVETVRQLLLRLPVEYRDLTRVHPIHALREGQMAAVAVRSTSPSAASPPPWQSPQNFCTSG